MVDDVVGVFGYEGGYDVDVVVMVVLYGDM